MNVKSYINIIYNSKNGIMPMYKSNKRVKCCKFRTSSWLKIKKEFQRTGVFKFL